MISDERLEWLQDDVSIADEAPWTEVMALARELREARKVVRRGRAWLALKKPVSWTEAEHRANPGVNCAGDVERKLAEAIVSHNEATK